MNDNGYWNEEWKTIVFDQEFTNKTRYEVSNFGRIRSFNNQSNGNILKGSILNGYRIFRLHLFSPRSEVKEAYFNDLKKQLSDLYKERRTLINNKSSEEAINQLTESIELLKKDISKKLQKDLKKRSTNHHFFVHRLVAQYFLNQPDEQHSVVSHLDYNKLNNRASNLQWMTKEANFKHQQNSPNVIKEKAERKYKPIRNKGLKLTSTQVLHIKMQLKRKTPYKQISKQFGISEMQVWRIKSGENWSEVKLADE